MKYTLAIILSLVSVFGFCQGNYLLQMDFAGCTATDISGFNLPITTIGMPSCVCSPNGDAFAFNGLVDGFTVQDTTLKFQQAYSISLVFRPDANLDNQRMISYKEDCTSQQGFNISYNGSSNSVTFELFESLGRLVFFEQNLDDKQCWHAITFVKSGSNYIVYLYGEEVFQTTAAASFDVGDNGVFSIGTGPCVPGLANGFNGAINYVSVYNEVLPISEIQSQVFVTNQILTPDTLIFIGDMVTPQVDAPCVSNFAWNPSLGVNDPSLAEPDLSPTETTIYSLTMTDGSCTVIDSIRVLVIDPTQVTCEELILPTAFTPNHDGLNDTYFISNGFVVEELIRFEIFDRWGGKLFSTSDVSMGWDGTHKGEPVMPGVYVFKAEYVCNGETKTEVRSFSLLN